MGEEVVVGVGERSSGWDRQMLYLGGSGGTGKSRVIHAIKALFERTGCRNQLLVSATTGTAAKLIAGSTMDSLCGFGRSNRTKTADFDDDEDYDYGDSSFQRTDVDNSWTSCRLLILDEASMAGCGKLARILEALCKAKSNVLPFGDCQFYSLAISTNSLQRWMCRCMSIPLLEKCHHSLVRQHDEWTEDNRKVTPYPKTSRRHGIAERTLSSATWSCILGVGSDSVWEGHNCFIVGRSGASGPDLQDKEWWTTVLIVARIADPLCKVYNLGIAHTHLQSHI